MRHCAVWRPQGLICLLSCALFLPALVTRAHGQAGPPFQTDDPTPVDLGHYEAYVFGTLDGTPAELDTISPGFEFNWGLCRVSSCMRFFLWVPSFPPTIPSMRPVVRVRPPSVWGIWSLG